MPLPGMPLQCRVASLPADEKSDSCALVNRQQCSGSVTSLDLKNDRTRFTAHAVLSPLCRIHDAAVQEVVYLDVS